VTDDHGMIIDSAPATRRLRRERAARDRAPYGAGRRSRAPRSSVRGVCEPGQNLRQSGRCARHHRCSGRGEVR
jgi:hypothetical protein